MVWLDSEDASSPATNLVVDAYDGGQLWRRDEILELFGLQALVPAEGRQVSAPYRSHADPNLLTLTATC